MPPNLLRRLRALHRTAPEERSLGQSLVEFALTLPVILMLTLIALDFGRVYLGYINVQNMSRIAANFAANNPTAWGTTPDAAVQAQYRNQILADASATNCDLPQSGGVDVVPAPVFSDVDGDGTPDGLGDRAQVQITCTFGVITPVISNIVGGSVSVSAESDFPVKSAMSHVDGAGGGGGPVLPNAAFVANLTVSSLNPGDVTISDLSPFAVEFRDTSGGSPTAWSWDFGDGASSTLRDPLDHTYSCTDPSCTFHVSMTASNANGSSTAYIDVTAIGTSLVAFSADRTLVSPGLSVQFTDASASGATAWAWDFGDGSTATTQNPTHSYATAGSYTVTLTVTYPDPTGDETLPKAGYISVQDDLCTVPSLIGQRFNNAQAIWQGSPYKFTGNVVRDTGAPSGNFIITAQSLTATSLAPCSSDVSVTAP